MDWDAFFFDKLGLIFIGHFMLPEATFGQFMVPRHSLSIELMAQNKPKSGQYMVPAPAILWVK
jgi:hypothetical protein